MITPKMKRRIKQELSAQKPTVWVGKEGATQKIINEINRQLEQHEVVKAKMHQTALKDQEAKDVATNIAARTESTLVDIRGHTLVLYKKRQRK